MGLDLDVGLETIRKCQPLTEPEVKQLCRFVIDILVEESNVQIVSSPVVICGDIHGQFQDLLELFKTGGQVDDGTNYIFMGDYVDRGYHSLETFTLLMLLKAKYPDRITLLRGNHETRAVTQIYGFYEECVNKYGGGDAWRACMEVFDCLNIAALVDDKVFCVHGGLSPDVRSINQINSIQRKQEIPNDGAYCDLMWSDPEPVESWTVNPRGCGWLFGARATREFCHLNGLDLICRAHQLVQEGYKYHFDECKVVTVWSAPNYCYRCGNLASVLRLDQNGNREFLIFNEVPVEKPTSLSTAINGYFL
eukprot:NODE_4854_length_1104_cov_15.896024_g4309_i0.p1 GENE.NODE_4854_length_1104_cov_15.896024_g4309_i0~~NODE_4854_length_1104_cov_15.896024_g4309_i0.p1  ORF type:complete len:307 (-),score=68.80 NODE_4854_length_1104_cov_15.896024_g4309_i0:97-1017(-)